MAVSIKNPAIPFVFSIPGKVVTVGQTFVVKGEAPHHANRFNFNLIQNATQLNIFHLDFRFDQGQTVRNTNFPTGQWSFEERSGLPVQKGRQFKLEIRVLPDRFQIFVDGHHHCDFMHRAPNSIADALQIQGDIIVHGVKLKN